MSKNTTSLSFSTGAHEVNALYDGKLLIHTTVGKNNAKSHVFSLAAGSFDLETLFKLDLKGIDGACTVAVKGGSRKSLKKNGKFSVPAGKSFTLKAAKPAVLQGTPKPGPGLGDIKIIRPRVP